VLVLDDLADTRATITGFATGDTIDVNGITADGKSYAAGVLTLTNGGVAVGTLAISGAYTSASFTLASTGSGVVITACFARGTRIATARGNIAVEDLHIGDRAVTALDRRCEPIVWIGRRAVNCRRHPNPAAVWPVRVAAGAFGPGLPARDLFLSPDHAVFIDGVLIPIKYLINGRTVAQERRDAVHYFHVELARHDIVAAEGLACESFLDTGNKADFDNGGAVLRMHPEFALRVWATQACAPLVLDGAELEAARSFLLERAALLGLTTTRDPDLRLRASRQELRPLVCGRTHRFHVPAAASGVRLVSRHSVPAEMHDDSGDHRRLGVAVSGLVYGGAAIALADPCLGSGWHKVEHGGADAAWRWTDGDAGMTLPGGQVLDIEVAMTERYWLDESPAAMDWARSAASI
jgi:hypothetical protein